ncbi:MAG: VanW family protein [Lawsonibacter sp.]|jgi:vancomycin resistance protein YoaR
MDGQRIEKGSGGAKKWLIVAAVIVAVLVLAYLGLCVWVGRSNTVLPNTTADGVELGGLTREDARSKLEQELNSQNNGFCVNLTVPGQDKSYAFPADSTNIVVDPQQGAQEAWQTGREYGFLAQGWYLLKALIAGNEVELPYQFTPVGESEVERLLDQVDEELGGGVKETTWEVVGDELHIQMGEPGHAVNREQAKQVILEQTSLQDETPVELEVQITEPAAVDMAQVHEEIYTEVKEASLDRETSTIISSVTGLDFDPNEAAKAVTGADWGTTVSIPLEVTEPKVSTQQLKELLFRDLLGEGTSTVSGTANRKSNVKLSAAACNGVILLPGEVFSYNNTTGSRTADKGYLPAPAYVGGASSDEVGGGICQTSSTIYYAVLHTTLEIVERAPHRYAVGYVPDGMDATVWYGSTDFRFKNNTDYPIKIVTESYDKGGERKLTVKIYGTNVDGSYAIPERVQSNWIQPGTSYVADESVPRGTLVLDKKQNSYRGRTAHTYRYIYDKDGNLIEKQDMGVSNYKKRDNLYHYNPLDGDPSTWPDGVPPKPDTGTSSGTGTETGTDVETGGSGIPDTGTETGAETGSSSNSGRDSQTSTETQTGAQTGTGNDSTQGSEAESGSNGGNQPAQDASSSSSSTAGSSGGENSKPSQDVGA